MKIICTILKPWEEFFWIIKYWPVSNLRQTFFRKKNKKNNLFSFKQKKYLPEYQRAINTETEWDFKGPLIEIWNKNKKDSYWSFMLSIFSPYSFKKRTWIIVIYSQKVKVHVSFLLQTMRPCENCLIFLTFNFLINK